jgi:hypothetical protein
MKSEKSTKNCFEFRSQTKHPNNELVCFHLKDISTEKLMKSKSPQFFKNIFQIRK